MGLRINNNLEAQNALRQLNINQMSFSKSMQRISSGKRVNSAADDAAGYAISNKLQAQSKGLDQASANAQDGISMIQTASGGLQTTQDLLQRFRQLAVQSANDTNTSSDRTQLQSEADQISNEITQIAGTTQFNTKNLLDGAQATTSTYTGGTAGAVTGFTGTGTPTVTGASGLNNGSVGFALSTVGSTATTDGSAGTLTYNGATYKLDQSAPAGSGTHAITYTVSTTAGVNSNVPAGLSGFSISLAG
ncbi:MAG: flagellin, partial [Chloroflexota bacterium]|nr:flagellin [Chloroflexota bacterium]